MNIAVEAELRLVQVIREARILINEMQELKKDFVKRQESAQVSKIDRTLLTAQIAKLNVRINTVTQSIHSASIAVDKMHGNLKWKEAIAAVYGEDGIQACIAYFESQRYAEKSTHSHHAQQPAADAVVTLPR